MRILSPGTRVGKVRAKLEEIKKPDLSTNNHSPSPPAYKFVYNNLAKDSGLISKHLLKFQPVLDSDCSPREILRPSYACGRLAVPAEHGTLCLICNFPSLASKLTTKCRPKLPNNEERMRNTPDKKLPREANRKVL